MIGSHFVQYKDTETPSRVWKRRENRSSRLGSDHRKSPREVPARLDPGLICTQCSAKSLRARLWVRGSLHPHQQQAGCASPGRRATVPSGCRGWLRRCRPPSPRPSHPAGGQDAQRAARQARAAALPLWERTPHTRSVSGLCPQLTSPIGMCLRRSKTINI